jgi:hypothetical protein
MKTYLRLILPFLILASSASAYDLQPGNWLIRGVIGGSINVVREDSASRPTPGAGAMVGFETEYMFDQNWTVLGAIRPVFAPGFVDLGFGLGAKYRWTDVGIPFIPFASVALTPAILIPTGDAKSHFNLGLRPSIGCDYFVMRDLAFGLEAALEPSYLFGSGYRSVELSIDILLGITWRL